MSHEGYTIRNNDMSAPNGLPYDENNGREPDIKADAEADAPYVEHSVDDILEHLETNGFVPPLTHGI